jgi:hypothetical protein
MESNGKTGKTSPKGSLTLRSIFRCMMEGGYYPRFEKDHIQFGIDDNIAVLEYEEGILAVRLFFSIEEDSYDLFLEASNCTMTETYIVKPAVLSDRLNIMFSCETMCDNLREFRKFFPRSIESLRTTLKAHKSEMKRLMLEEKISSVTLAATEDISIISDSKRTKPLS